MIETRQSLKSGLSVYQEICVSTDTILLVRLDSLIEQNYIKEKDPGFYAERLGYSLKSLNRITVFHTGKTVYRLLQDTALRKAQALILYSKVPVKLIAYELGFSSPAYFSRWFKKVTSMTAKEYKRLNKPHMKSND